MSRLWQWAGVLCLLSACQVDHVANARFECTGDRQCANDFTCHDGVCTPGPILDAGPSDAEPDSTPDADLDPADVGAGADASADDRDGDGFADGVDNCPAVANDQADLDGDGLGDSCDDDRDGDGVNQPADNCPGVPNPAQRDRNANGQGDACEVACAAPGARCTLRKATCTVREACGAGFAIFEYEGTCGERWCGDFIEPAREVMGGGCGPQEVCKPEPEAPCVPVEICPGDVDCVPEADGAPCAIGAEPDRLARCVDGACRAWDCMAPECNEVGARRFSIDASLNTEAIVPGQPGVRIEQPGAQLAWAFPGREPGGNLPGASSPSLADAHRRCAALVYDEHDDWRLPTMQELHSMGAFRGSFRFDVLQIIARTEALFYSRTLVDDANVMAVTLIDTVASPIPIEGVDAQVVCVRGMTPAIRDLSLRRARFAALADLGDVLDTHSDILWTDMGMRASYQDARAACDGIGASMPSIDALTTLLTFTGPDLPTPASWIAWDDDRPQPSNMRVWSFATTPVEGEHLHLNFSNGEVSAVRDPSPLDVLCVHWPELPEPGE